MHIIIVVKDVPNKEEILHTLYPYTNLLPYYIRKILHIPR